MIKVSTVYKISCFWTVCDGAKNITHNMNVPYQMLTKKKTEWRRSCNFEQSEEHADKHNIHESNNTLCSRNGGKSVNFTIKTDHIKRIDIEHIQLLAMATFWQLWAYGTFMLHSQNNRNCRTHCCKHWSSDWSVINYLFWGQHYLLW